MIGQDMGNRNINDIIREENQKKITDADVEAALGISSEAKKKPRFQPSFQ